MPTPIINSQVDAINSTLGTLAGDLATLRPLIKTANQASYAAFATESANGAIASFNDGADEIPLKKLLAAITPIQNLNGQDAPYPAGGGKNKWSFNASYQSASSGTLISLQPFVLPAGTYAISMRGSLGSAMAVTFRDSSNTILKTITINGSAFVSGYYSTSFTLDSASATLNVYSSGAYDLSQIQIESGSTATDYAPYSNICPISGHTEANVTRTGKNIIWRDSSSNIYNGGHLIPVTNGETLYLYGEWTGGALIARLYSDIAETNKNNYSTQLLNISASASGSVITISVTADGYLGIAYNGAVVSYTVDKMMVSRTAIESATSYEPYAGQTYPISLGQTVYGGTLNVTTGVLTIDRAKIHLSPNDFTYWYAQYNQAYTQNVIASGVAAYDAAAITYICDTFKPVTNNSRQQNIGNLVCLISSGQAVACSSPAESLADFKTLIPNGIDFVYELATPTTVQLTAHQVTSLLGDTNVWADSGNVDVVIRADTALYIDKVIAQALNA